MFFALDHSPNPGLMCAYHVLPIFGYFGYLGSQTLAETIVLGARKNVQNAEKYL